MARKLLVLLGCVVVVVVAVLVVRGSETLTGPREEFCSAEVDGALVEVDLAQARYASLIAATAVKRGMPARATTIGIATAYQESKIRNLHYGDRDSLGLFQQRPSQDWGTPAQVQDPRYAVDKFLQTLEQVDGYATMEVTEAAQAVQHSAYGDAYSEHEPYARVLASALSGNSPAAFTCQVDPPAEGDQEIVSSGLTVTADQVRADVQASFGAVPSGGYAPGGVDSGHSPGSTHYDGRAIDFFFKPVSDSSLTNGWALAQYLVANAPRLKVQTVIFDDRIWTAQRSSSGWREYDPPARAGASETLRHQDHVHVDVA